MVPDEALIDQLLGQLVDLMPAWEAREGRYLESLLANLPDEGIDPAAAYEVVRPRGRLDERGLRVTRQAKFATVATQLRALLPASEWRRLPQLIAAQKAKAGAEAKVESDRQEREARRRAEEVERERHGSRERRRIDADALAEKRAAAFARAGKGLEDNFLRAQENWREDPDHSLLSEAEYLELRTCFVMAWAKRVLDLDLDAEQAVAVGALDGDVQTIARAGSGKTRTLVTRAVFLQRHCRVPPTQLLLLAFNKSAAAAMRKRLHKHLGDEIPHVMTFHALAYALVRPEEALIYDEPSAASQLQSREIQEVIDEHLRSDEHRGLVRDVMLAHFRDDWDSIIEGGYGLPIEELVALRSALPRETLNREYVKSYGERLIANTLFENDIVYSYERNHRRDDFNYRPDFMIDTPGGPTVVIEYFGLAGDPDYDESSASKRAYWATQRPKYVFIELTPADIKRRGVEDFRLSLLDELRAAGVTTRELAIEEIWERIRARAIDDFTGAVKTFVNRCRKGNLAPDQVDALIAGHRAASNGERLFLLIASAIHRGYLERLRSNALEDFDGLLWRAAELLQGGEGAFKRDRGRERGNIGDLRFVLIDEFQDFSAGFYALARGVRALSPSVGFFCVGDDWQAINGFAGSDLRYFRLFSDHFEQTQVLAVRTNYRSPHSIVELGNALMVGNGVPAVAGPEAGPGWVRTARLTDFAPTPSEQARYDGDDVTPALLRVVKHLFDSGKDVVLLSRTNHLPWYVKFRETARPPADTLERFADHIRSFFPAEDRGRLKISTTHKFKGLESPAVVILDADARQYPHVHPLWVFARVFGDTIPALEAEERRLFYVALTRSEHSLVVLSQGGRQESPFLQDIRGRIKTEALSWSDLPPVPSLDGPMVEVRVRTPYDFAFRDSLMGQRFAWRTKLGCWCRFYPEEGFAADKIFAQEWATEDVEVLVVAGDGSHLATKPATRGPNTGWFSKDPRHVPGNRL